MKKILYIGAGIGTTTTTEPIKDFAVKTPTKDELKRLDEWAEELKQLDRTFKLERPRSKYHK